MITEDHSLERTVMMWGVKYKANVVKGGKIFVQQDCKVMTPVKYLLPEHMANIKVMLEKKPGEIWNGYDSETWVRVIKNEIIYRNKRANVIIQEAIKISRYNAFGKLCKLYQEEAFKFM